MAENKNTFVRVNSRIKPEQQKFIKGLAKKLKITEGEALRVIVDYYMHLMQKPN